MRACICLGHSGWNMIYDSLESKGGNLFCSSCGHDNPRENRYCGMCGTPFPHRPLTVPDAQSTLTFSSAPIVITPSQLPTHAAAPPQPPPKPVVAPVQHEEPAPLDSTLVEHPPAPVTEERPFAAATVPTVESAPLVEAPPPLAAPVIEPIVEFAK